MPGQPYPDGLDAFNAVASTYEAWFASPLGRVVDHQELQALAHILSGVQPGACIDIGAGSGHIAAWLAGQGHQVTAVEPSCALRQEGMQRTAGLVIHWCDAHAENLPFADASFDAPQAMAPFADADQAGRRAGHQPALESRQWEKRP